MILSIVSPEEHITYDVEYIEVQTASGSLVIHPGHAPILITLDPDAYFSFLTSINQEKKTISITHRGFLDVNRAGVTAIINQNIK